MFKWFSKKKTKRRKVKPLTGQVYFIRARCEGNPIKIGYSINPKARIKALQTASPVKLRLLKTIPGNRQIERALHRKFKKYRLRGEWFKGSKELLQYIKEVKGE